MEVVERVREPSRVHEKPTPVSTQRTRAGEFGGSVDSGGTLNRQDSIAPILRGGRSPGDSKDTFLPPGFE